MRADAVSTNRDAGGPCSSSIRQVQFNFDTPIPSGSQPSVAATAAAVFAASFDDGTDELNRYVLSLATSPSRSSTSGTETNEYSTETETTTNPSVETTTNSSVETTTNPSVEPTSYTAAVG